MSEGVVTLYWNILSPYSRAVKALIDMANIEYKLISVDLLNGEQRKEDYLKINPKGLVPVLALADSTVITESVAILIYLCEKYPEKLGHLYGQSAEERSQVISSFSWIQFSFGHNIGLLWVIKRDYSWKYKQPIPESKIKTGEQKIQLGLASLQKLLEKTGYLALGKITIADILAYFVLTLIVYVGQDYHKYKNVTQWFKKIYAVKEIKEITHQWFPLAQQVAQAISKAPLTPSQGSL